MLQVTEAVQTPPASESPRPSNALGLGLLAAWTGLGFALSRVETAPGGLTFAFILLGWVLSVMAHEFSHAGVAWLGGDHTVAQKGYLAFDPRRYGDLGVSLVLPLLALALGGIALPGGAVYLRPDLMRSRAWRSAASLAGPAATFIILAVLAIVLRTWASIGADSALFPALSLLAFLQAMALILNLLPIPGLDGFNALRPFLPDALNPYIRKAEGLVIVLILLAVFFVPGFGRLLFGSALQVSLAFGLFPEAVAEGWRAFHFWR